VLARLQPLILQRDELLAAAQASGIPMARIGRETGLPLVDVRRSIDAALRRNSSTPAG
jgi:hypothetical protein